MIHKNINYGNVENVTVAEFGKGTLSVVDGINDGYLSLLIKTKEFSPIGEVSGSEKSSDEFKPELVLAFHNAASFEVFYEYVENIREKFQSALNSGVSVAAEGEIILCDYCGHLETEHEENCLKSPETKAELLINAHQQLIDEITETNGDESNAISHSLITVNMVKAVLPSGDLMAYYSRVRQILINKLHR